MADETSGQGEPVAADRRLSGVTRPTDHAAHDPIAIAALAAGDLDGAERAAAEALTASCDACRHLLGDLVSLATSIHESPPAIPPRSRDFRVTEEDARRLANPWRRLTGWLAGPRGAVTRPLSGALVAMGIVAVLVSTGPFAGLGAGSAAMREQGLDAGAPVVPAASPASAAPLAPLPGAPDYASGAPPEAVKGNADGRGAAAGETDGEAGPSPSTGGSDDKAAPTPPADRLVLQGEAGAGPSLAEIGLVLIIAGGILFVVRPVVRRLA